MSTGREADTEFQSIIAGGLGDDERAALEQKDTMDVCPADPGRETLLSMLEEGLAVEHLMPNDRLKRAFRLALVTTIAEDFSPEVLVPIEIVGARTIRVEYEEGNTGWSVFPEGATLLGLYSRFTIAEWPDLPMDREVEEDADISEFVRPNGLHLVLRNAKISAQDQNVGSHMVWGHTFVTLQSGEPHIFKLVPKE